MRDLKSLYYRFKSYSGYSFIFEANLRSAEPPISPPKRASLLRPGARDPGATVAAARGGWGGRPATRSARGAGPVCYLVLIFVLHTEVINY